MKYDYTVQTIYGVTETCSTLTEAKRVGKKLLSERPDCDPVIDEYYKDDELTGRYWLYKQGKFTEPAKLNISFKGLIR